MATCPTSLLTPTLGLCSVTPTLPLFRTESVPVLLLGCATAPCARLAVGTASLITGALCDLGTNMTFFGIAAFAARVLSSPVALYWFFGFSGTNLQNQRARGEFYPNTLPRNSSTFAGHHREGQGTSFPICRQSGTGERAGMAPKR